MLYNTKRVLKVSPSPLLLDAKDIISNMFPAFDIKYHLRQETLQYFVSTDIKRLDSKW